MLSKRTIIGLVVGTAIIAIGGISLIQHIGTVTFDLNDSVTVGDSAVYRIPAPNHTPQHMEITGDSFELKLTSPFTGLQIPDRDSENEFESFKNRIDEPLTLDWTHVEDGETIIQIKNTGNSELEIKGIIIRSSDPIWFTYDLMVIISGMVIIGFSMGFTLRKPKGF